jgi:hypothetical protein
MALLMLLLIIALFIASLVGAGSVLKMLSVIDLLE